MTETPATDDRSRSRQVVASYDNYEEAERAVDYLSDNEFPVEKVAIIGTGLKTVEQVAGRVTTGRAALMGAMQGAMIGVLFGLFFGIIFDGVDFLGVVAYGLIVGTVFGSIFGALGQAAQGGRRDFASVRSMQAEQYEIQVEQTEADRASELLRGMTT